MNQIDLSYANESSVLYYLEKVRSAYLIDIAQENKWKRSQLDNVIASLQAQEYIDVVGDLVTLTSDGFDKWIGARRHIAAPEKKEDLEQELEFTKFEDPVDRTMAKKKIPKFEEEDEPDEGEFKVSALTHDEIAGLDSIPINRIGTKVRNRAKKAGLKMPKGLSMRGEVDWALDNCPVLLSETWLKSHEVSAIIDEMDDISYDVEGYQKKGEGKGRRIEDTHIPTPAKGLTNRLEGVVSELQDIIGELKKQE